MSQIAQRAVQQGRRSVLSRPEQPPRQAEEDLVAVRILQVVVRLELCFFLEQPRVRRLIHANRSVGSTGRSTQMGIESAQGHRGEVLVAVHIVRQERRRREDDRTARPQTRK